MPSRPVVWRAAARDDLAAIIRYIANSNPQAARRMRERIESAVLPLADHAHLFRRGRVAGTHELVAHPNYVIVYRITANQIEIISVLHTRRHYP